MTNKARLKQLHKQIQEPVIEHRTEKQNRKEKEIEANIPRGERANFLKATITLPPEILAALRDVGMKRKSEGQKDTDVSSLIREAVTEWLKKQ
jgi:hypothetical protein